MKKLTYLTIFTALLVFFLANSANALVDLNLNFDNAQNVKVEAFNCANADCSSVTPFTGSFPNGDTTTNGQVTIRFPSTLASENGYALYAVSPGFLPKVNKATLHSNGDENLYALSSTLSFEKAQVCRSSISEFSVTNDVKPFIPLVIQTDSSLDSTAASAFGLANGPVKYIPSDLADYFSALTNVALTIRDELGNEVSKQSANLNLKADETQRIQFSWTPEQSGGYSASVSTNVVDAQCASSETREATKLFSVLNEEPRDSCYTLLNDFKVEGQAKAGQKATASFTKISNHADNDGDLHPTETNLYYTIQQPEDLFGGETKFTRLSANSDATSAERYTFEWTPSEAGLYNLVLIGKASDDRCTSFERNTQEVATLQVQVASADVSYSVTFRVVDENGQRISGAQVDLFDEVQETEFRGTTNSNGEILFARVNPGEYDLTITHENFEDLDEDIQISGNTLFVKTLQRTTVPQDERNVVITVLDRDTNEPVPDAQVYVALSDIHVEPVQVETRLTDVNGRAFFRLTDGRYPYAVDPRYHEEFMSEEGFLVNGNDLFITVLVSRTSYPPTPVPPPRVPELSLSISSLTIPRGFEVRAGEELEVLLNMQHSGNEDLENTKVLISIPQLGIRSTAGPFDLDESESTSKRLTLNLPSETPQGVYYVRVEVHNNDVTRVLHRQIEVA
jgi:hypothetical protein